MILECKAFIRSRTRDGPEKLELRPEEYSMKESLKMLREVEFQPSGKKPRLILETV